MSLKGAIILHINSLFYCEMFHLNVIPKFAVIKLSRALGTKAEQYQVAPLKDCNSSLDVAENNFSTQLQPIACFCNPHDLRGAYGSRHPTLLITTTLQDRLDRGYPIGPKSFTAVKIPHFNIVITIPHCRYVEAPSHNYIEPASCILAW